MSVTVNFNWKDWLEWATKEQPSFKKYRLLWAAMLGEDVELTDRQLNEISLTIKQEIKAHGWDWAYDSNTAQAEVFRYGYPDFLTDAKGEEAEALAKAYRAAVEAQP